MEPILYIIAKVISLMLSAVSLAMFARVMMQIISRMTSYDAEGSKIYTFCYVLTEFFVTPFRYLCAKFNLFTGTPLDAPFFLAYFSIAILQGILPII